MAVTYSHDHENEIAPFAETNFRSAKKRFGIKTDDRRRHMYIVGKTGMGKTTLLENLVIADIMAGHGVGVVDPHGDFAEKLLDFIPPSRINDVVYFNPADMDYPVGFNILEAVDERHKHLVASGMMGVFKKIWPDVWSPRMEYILNNAILALLDFPGSTMLGVNRLLVDKEYRRRVIAKLKDPLVKSFWVDEYASYAERFRTEAIAPIQNKVGQFLSTALVRNIVAQIKSTINPRKIMDEGQILIMNLSKGRIGEDASRLLGGLLITKLQLAAMERVDVLETERKDFYLYVDEFQNFATESFANILSEARKYRLNLIVAHQYIEQLDEKVRAAVFGNIGTLLLFRVGGADAEFLEKEFAPAFMANDLVNLTKYDAYLKLMIDGVASNPFSATTLSPLGNKTDSREKVVRVSRERYAEKREIIEEKVTRWTGMDDTYDDEDEKEQTADKKERRYPGKILYNAPERNSEMQIPRDQPATASFGSRGGSPSFSGTSRQPIQAAPAPRKPTYEAREWISGHAGSFAKPFSKFAPRQVVNRAPEARTPPQMRRQPDLRPTSLRPQKGDLVPSTIDEKPISLKELVEKSKQLGETKKEKDKKPEVSENKSTPQSGSLKPGEVVSLDK